MFLGAVGHPRYDHGRNQNFNGKIGLYPMARQIPAQRTSRNRVRGTLEWKPIPSINATVYKEFIFDKLVPDILSKWPRTNRTIRIQHDNASAHMLPEEFDQIWEEKKAELHAQFSPNHQFKIGLIPQPTNSPGLNMHLGSWSV